MAAMNERPAAIETRCTTDGHACLEVQARVQKFHDLKYGHGSPEAADGLLEIAQQIAGQHNYGQPIEFEESA